jgi:hypothetical protein
MTAEQTVAAIMREFPEIYGLRHCQGASAETSPAESAEQRDQRILGGIQRHGSSGD